MLHIIPHWPDFNQSLQFNPYIHQAKLFVGHQQPTRMVLLDYAPNLQRFLHGHQLHLPVWSLFDELQQVEHLPEQSLRLTDFIWPTDAQFNQQAHFIDVITQAGLYAKVLLHNDNPDTINQIIYIKKDNHHEIHTLDSRGFISRIQHIDNGAVLDNTYLTPSGEVAAIEYFNEGQPGQIQLFSLSQHFFRTVYENLADLQISQLSRMMREQAETDRIIFPHEKLFLLDRVNFTQQIILYDNTGLDLTTQTLPDNVLQVINPLNKESHTVLSRQNLPTFVAKKQVPSSDITQLNIYWRIGDLAEDEQKDIFSQLTTAMSHFTHDKWLLTIVGDSVLANSVPNHLSHRIFFVDNANEQQVLFTLDNVRLVLDLSTHLDEYLQVAAISRQIPLLAKTNGMLVDNVQLTHDKTFLIDLTKLLDDFSFFDATQLALTPLINQLDTEAIFAKWQPILTYEKTDE